MSRRVPAETLAEMAEYYRARAPEYDEWFYRRGRYDRGADANALWVAEARNVAAALGECNLSGDVLELAGGTGLWTEHLARTARSVTVVDTSPEMLDINRARLAGKEAQYISADLFTWRPDQVYDAVCFAFWLSHVPEERLDDFVRVVTSALRPGGSVFFVDSRHEARSTAVDHVLPETDSQCMTRRLNDGREFSIVKNFYEASTIEAHFAAAGIALDVRVTDTFFIYGWGEYRGGS